MNDENTSVGAPAVKIITAWAMVGITSWADFASFLAAMYTLCLLIEWCWKRFVKDFCITRGWIKRPERRRADRSVPEPE